MGNTSKNKKSENSKSDDNIFNRYRFDSLTKTQLMKENFRNDKLKGFDEESSIIADQALYAIDGGGEVFAANIDKNYAIVYIFSKSGSEEEGYKFELTGEYVNDDLTSPELYEVFDNDIDKILVSRSAKYDNVIFNDKVYKRDESSTNFSFIGLIIGIVVSYIIFGIGMNNKLMGIVLGIFFGIMMGVVFSSYENAQKGAGISDENMRQDEKKKKSK